MPTTITGQNGKVVKQNTHIGVTGCGVQDRRPQRSSATRRTSRCGPSPRAASAAAGQGLDDRLPHFDGAQNAATLKVPLSRGARQGHKPFKVKVRVGFFPKKKRRRTSVAYTTVTFR